MKAMLFAQETPCSREHTAGEPNVTAVRPIPLCGDVRVTALFVRGQWVYLQRA